MPDTESVADSAQVGELVTLTPGEIQFRCHRGLLMMTCEGNCSHLDVSVRRAFPLTEPKRYLSVLDSKKKEIGLLVDPSKLDRESHAILQKQLERNYVLPVVQRIRKATERFGVVDWQVDTDRGPALFTTRDLRTNVVRPTAHRYILNDVGGNSYDVQDLRQLDAASRNLLVLHL